LFSALVLGGGLVIGTVTASGVWYATLNKPTELDLRPVWTTLYIMIANRRLAGLGTGP
jgi:translocator protein